MLFDTAGKRGILMHDRMLCSRAVHMARAFGCVPVRPLLMQNG